MTPSKSRVLRALKKTMIPIARMLMRSNVDCKQFIEVAKLAFVEVATDEYGIRDRKTNVSRVAILTGLTRKDVSRVRANMADREELRDVLPSASERLLSGWHEDEDFLDGEAKPRTLYYDGPGATFLELLNRYTGDVPVGAMQKELTKAGLIEEQKGGLLKVNRSEPIKQIAAGRIEEAFRTLAVVARSMEENAKDSGDWPVEWSVAKAMTREDRDRLRFLARREMSKTSKKLKGVFDAYEEVYEMDSETEQSSGVMQLYFETETKP